MCTWQLYSNLLQEGYDSIECFAGSAKLTWCLRQAGYRATAVDIESWGAWHAQRCAGGHRPLKNNPLDFLQPSGFVSFCGKYSNLFLVLHLPCLVCRHAFEVDLTGHSEIAKFSGGVFRHGLQLLGYDITTQHEAVILAPAGRCFG